MKRKHPWKFNSKIEPEQVPDMMKDYREGILHVEQVAKKYNLSVNGLHLVLQKYYPEEFNQFRIERIKARLKRGQSLTLSYKINPDRFPLIMKDFKDNIPMEVIKQKYSVSRNTIANYLIIYNQQEYEETKSLRREAKKRILNEKKYGSNKVSRSDKTRSAPKRNDRKSKI